MIAVVIPCYKVKQQIISVLSAIPPYIDKIYLVDDACPEKSGKFVEKNMTDRRITFLYHLQNTGVGGAVLTGYQTALNEGATIIVKIDGDGQMDLQYLPDLLQPIIDHQADYTKGNRFYNLEDSLTMPKTRIIGNSILSLINKISSGYWNIVDPTNGFTAIHKTALKLLPLHKLANDYFFESDMLFRLNTIRAVVQDVQMPAKYGNENSSLKIFTIMKTFPGRYLNLCSKRIFYNYFLRDFNAGTLQLLSGSLLLLFGCFFGGYHWHKSTTTAITASSGTVMLAALPLLIGIQLLLNALNYDISNIPKFCQQKPTRKCYLAKTNNIRGRDTNHAN